MGMREASAVCRCCGKVFIYKQFTKPRRYCSGGCEYNAERLQQNDRRARIRAEIKAARSGTLDTSAGLQGNKDVVH